MKHIVASISFLIVFLGIVILFDIATWPIFLHDSLRGALTDPRNIPGILLGIAGGIYSYIVSLRKARESESRTPK